MVFPELSFFWGIGEQIDEMCNLPLMVLVSVGDLNSVDIFLCNIIRDAEWLFYLSVVSKPDLKVSQVSFEIVADFRVKNRNVPAVNRRRILIGWKMFKWRSHGSGRGIENRKRKSVGHQTRRCENGRKILGALREVPYPSRSYDRKRER